MQKRILKNGLTILFDKRKTDSVAINVTVKVGSNNEKVRILGLSHFLEHILFEGTKKRTAIELANEIEKVGGYMNASTSNEYTDYYAIVPSNYFDTALEIVADMLINSKFERKVIEKERQVILDEISLHDDDPNTYQWILFSKCLFKKANAKNPVAGSYASVSRATSQDIVMHFRKHYVPNNIIVSISGNAKDVFGKVENKFGMLERQEIPKYKDNKEPRDNKPTLKKVGKKINHSYLVIGYKAPTIKSKDTFAMEVIRAILGKGQSARLFNEIRTKRGLGYAVGAQYSANLGFGYFASFVSADKKNIPICREILLNEFKLTGLTRKEVEEAKRYIIGSNLIRNEGNGERSEGNALFEMAKMSLKSYLKAIKAVKFETVRKTAKKYFNGAYTEVFLEQR